MKKEIVLIGGGGHCKSVIDVIESTSKFIIKGILDKDEMVNTFVGEYPVIGTDNDISEFTSKGFQFLITVGQIKTSIIREKIFNVLKNHNCIVPSIIASTARVSPHSRVGEGTVIMHHALVNYEADIGFNTIINSGSLVEHGVSVGNHCHISTGTILNGDCKIGDRCFIGSRSVVLQGVTILDDVILGAGSIVTKDISDPGVYIGVPARKIQ